MNEEFLHYLWKYRLYKLDEYKSDDGQTIEIIHPGIQNHDAGPDFFNAKIKIGNTLWAGNVEIHLKSSDWYRHGHQNDPAYNNVILHVVLENDFKTKTYSDLTVPVWEMPIESWHLDNYKHLTGTPQKIGCANRINQIPRIEISNWIERMAIERLENKTILIEQLLSQYQNDQDEVFYILTARNFGFSVNGDAFEQMARQTPWKIVLKNRDNLETLEALFLGQAGFLSDEMFQDNYIKKLCDEYKFLKNKYSLTPISIHHWKFLRLRPSNFPTIRLMQFAKLLFQNNYSSEKILKEKDLYNIYDLLMIETSPYWETHYKPDKESPKSKKKVGKTSAELVIMNTIVPFLFSLGTKRANEELTHKALDWLQSLPPDNNSIISDWNNIEIVANNAMESQALIYLTKNYCINKKCLHCKIGHLVIK